MENVTKGYEALLTSKGLKKTGTRLHVLDVLSKSKFATSQPFLEHLIGKDADRVTLYRILKAFEEKGIIHKIIDAHGTANYAICSKDCNEHKHQDEHLHFNCTVCEKVYCLDQIKIPQLNFPKGFKVEHLSLIASGICDMCIANA
jgi:Fur family ferric uptake transcriptional regulator